MSPSSSPLHQRIRSDIEERIRAGVWAPGTRLPTEAELQEIYGVSRVTVQRTMRDLAQAGLVVRYRRRGTFVAPTASAMNLLKFVDPLATGPEAPGPHVIDDARVVPAAEADVEMPGVAPDVPVNRLRRRKLDTAGHPLAIEHSAVPFAIAPHLLDGDLEQLTVHAYLRTAGLTLARSRLYLEPAVLDGPQAEVLGRSPGQPVLRFTRHTWLAGGALAESMWHLVLTDNRFYVEQYLPEGGA